MEINSYFTALFVSDCVLIHSSFKVNILATNRKTKGVFYSCKKRITYQGRADEASYAI